MRLSKFIGENKGTELFEIVHDCFVDSGLEQPGIIGILYPFDLGTVEEMEFYTWLLTEFDPSGPHHLIVPVPDINWFNMNSHKDVVSLAGRVARDRTDGVRYNRLYIALYRENNPPPEAVIVEHDHFFKIYKENGTHRFGAVYAIGEKK